MTKVLVVEDQRDLRTLLMDTLADQGYDVLDAANGAAALELASHEAPDMMLLDLGLPDMDGFEVLRRLRQNPDTNSLPVVILSALPAVNGEKPGMDLGVSHYLSKPWEPGVVELAVRVALREAMAGSGAPDPGEDPELGLAVIKTGNMPLDQKLRGGIPLGSISLVEGFPEAGKSILCQHLAYESLLSGHGVAYFTSEYSPQGLITKMASIGREVSD